MPNPTAQLTSHTPPTDTARPSTTIVAVISIARNKSLAPALSVLPATSASPPHHQEGVPPPFFGGSSAFVGLAPTAAPTDETRVVVAPMVPATTDDAPSLSFFVEAQASAAVVSTDGADAALEPFPLAPLGEGIPPAGIAAMLARLAGVMAWCM